MWFANGSSDDCPVLRLKSDSSVHFAFALGYTLEEMQMMRSHKPFHGQHSVHFAPGRETPTENYLQIGWMAVLDQFRSWITYVKRELEGPDRWAEASSATKLERVIAEEYDGPFTVEEIRRIQRSFEAAKQEIEIKRLLSAEELTSLTAQMQQQQASASSLGRIEWQKEAVREWVKWAIRTGLESSAAQQVLDIISSQFHWLSEHLITAVKAFTHFLLP